MIGVVTTSYPRSPGDPAGCFVADRVRVLERAGARVQVVTPPSALPLFAGGGAPEMLERGGPGAWLQAALAQASLIADVAARAAAWRRVESHWLVPSALAVTCAAPGLPHTAFAHSGDVALLERLPWGDALARRVAAAPEIELVFVSADLRRRFARLAGRLVGRVEVLQPDPQLFRAARPAERSALRRARGLDGCTVLGVGRLVPIKGWDVLVDAVAGLGAPAATVVIAGEGPEEASLRRRAQRSGVRLRLLGRLPRAQVADWMRAADVYVQPSRRLPSGRTEGMPVAALEALACRLPVIASATGGLADLPGMGAAVCAVPAESPMDLRSALRMIGESVAQTPTR